ncbi:MAG: D-alanyl-D-alanine carboxypeptidase [Clostridia bacterium]|nr:D-alanyl-D-alanine carboxypeptidase [Clostridia bacterium]
MKKISIFCIFLIVFTCLPQRYEALGVSASYACVMDSLTGRVLYEKNAYKRHSMASTTKIMTALVALENGNPDDVVTVSANAAGTEGSSIYLKTNEKIKLIDLLYGLMLASGNDAAIAIAEHIGGSVDDFSKMMNDKAAEIGAKDTQFKNPNGLDEEGHYTTAYDLALITRAALKNKDFSEIVKTKKKTISNGEESYGRALSNHNKLLNLYQGCDGVKTGFTKKTGRCLVSAATRNNFQVIAVTLNAPDDWNDHTNMLNYAFNNYSARPLVLKDMVIKTVPVENGDTDTVKLLANDVFYLTMEDKEGLNKVKLEYDVPKSIPAPVMKGTVLGKLKIFYEGVMVKEIELGADCDIKYVEPPKKNTFEKIADFFINLWD